MPEEDGWWLVTGPNGACRARHRLLDFIGSWSYIISKNDWLIAKKYIFVTRAEPKNQVISCHLCIFFESPNYTCVCDGYVHLHVTRWDSGVSGWYVSFIEHEQIFGETVAQRIKIAIFWISEQFKMGKSNELMQAIYVLWLLLALNENL